MVSESAIRAQRARYRMRLPRELDPRHAFDEFESLVATRARRAARIRCLTRSGDKRDQELASKLRRCSKGCRCGSPACPRCMRQFRRWCAPAVITALRTWKLAAEPLVLTLVVPKWAVQFGNLHEVRLDRIARSVSKRFDRYQLRHAIVLGGFDFDLVVTDNDADSRTWQPHLHLLILNVQRCDLQPLLESYRKDRCASVPRPAVVSQFNNPIPQICYLFKPYWCRRSRYKEFRADRMRPTRNTRKQSLKSLELRELLTFLDCHSQTDLMFRKNVRIYGNRLTIKMSPTNSQK